MRTPSLIWILHLVNLTKGLDGTGRSPSAGGLCPGGCATCSAPNGCLSCMPRLFFHLELDGMRQRGTCVSSCPRGHYGMRSPHISTCARCKEDCASCFSERFCTHCHAGHFLFRGKCESSCPDGLMANAALRECTECSLGCELCVSRAVCASCRADLFALQVHCEVGGWTAWSPCVRKRSQRVTRRGQETRNRPVLRPPSVYGDPCPQVSEIRKCVIKKEPEQVVIS
ncbi:R-spondin-3 [Liparis tanakae]|uniref:R-spondin-3 n=1 Tax=Liparis tanakae TaxID=230148 RepID=A0A4Z2F3M7_9TELE|nr:R-spondin-3 [Liparis tanakae]